MWLRKQYIVLVVILSSLYTQVHASIYSYIYPYNNPSFSNYGTIGLIQNPTARFLDEGTLAFSWTHNEPYLRGSIVAYPFSWLEASFQYTDINNRLYSEFSEFSGSQSLKDKSFDFKFLLSEETLYLPQFSIGVRDMGGTGLFGAEYLVASKKIGNNLDITLGLGWGNLNNNSINNPLKLIHEQFGERNAQQGLGGKIAFKDLFSGEAGYFGGLEYSLRNLNGAKIKIELDGTNYSTENDLPLKQTTKMNIGIVFPVNDYLVFKFSSSRGREVSFGFSYNLNLGNKNPFKLKKEPRKKLDNQEIIQSVTALSDENLNKASLLYLSRNNIDLQKTSILGDQFHVVYSQPKYRSSAMSAGRVIDIIDQIAPSKIEAIKVSEINGGLGMFSVETDRDSFKRYKKFGLPSGAQQNLKFEQYYFKEEGHTFSPLINFPKHFYSIGPDLRSQIGGPDGFFFGDLKLTFDSELLLSRNLSLITIASYGLFDNMNDLKLPSNSILPHVRTDIVDYLKSSREFSFRRMQLNYYKQISRSSYLKLSGGILESMFNGYGFEYLYRPYNKNFGIGLEAWEVYQRSYDQMFKTLDYQTVTGHLTIYYEIPRTNILFAIKGGKYLAKDSGFTFDFSRSFTSGLRIGAYFSLTDISEEEFGEGSFDKGFYFWIPIESFTSKFSRKSFGWGLRPLTRDGAQQIIHGFPLWGVTDPSSYINFKNNINDFYN